MRRFRTRSFATRCAREGIASAPGAPGRGQLIVRQDRARRPGSLHCEEMFPCSLVASLQGFLIERASSVRIRSHANHSPASEHHGIIGFSESDECTTILPFASSGQQQTRSGDITYRH